MSSNDFQRLMENHAKNLKRIQEIQNDVAQDYDNLSNPVPLFSQL